jgi:hypothetical protein
MGFLPENPKSEFESQVQDIYVLLRSNPNNKILSDHIMVVLINITGIFDNEVDVQMVPTSQWQKCGFHDEETGKFMFRKGEGKVIQNHFKLL